MKHRDVAVILATCGMGLVRAAYSAGKPAYGVGPGNAPAFIERTANVKKAVHDITTGKTFDNGLLCSSENSVVVDAPIADEVKREFQTQGGYFLSAAEMESVARVLVTFGRVPLFFYVLQWLTAHVLAVAAEWIAGKPVAYLFNLFVGPPPPAGTGFGLATVYALWILGAILLYPLCVWFAGVKARRRDWWLSYV